MGLNRKFRHIDSTAEATKICRLRACGFNAAFRMASRKCRSRERDNLHKTYMCEITKIARIACLCLNANFGCYRTMGLFSVRMHHSIYA